MKALSVLVLGGGSWARALHSLLIHNQAKQPGTIARVGQYLPRPGAVSVGGPPPKVDSDDATMHLMVDPRAGMALLQPPERELRAGSEDATMLHMTADAMAGLLGQPPPNPGLDEVRGADLILLTAPAASVRALLREVKSALRPEQLLIHLVDGFVTDGLSGSNPAALVSTVIQEETPLRRIGALAGPALPADLEEWSPAGLTVGSNSPEVGRAALQVLHCQTLRIYCNDDLRGVEVARALTAMLAIGSGVCDVLEFGAAARSILVARGASEIARLGVALGGKEKTFLGLAGFGSFMLASENSAGGDYQLGRLLGTGQSLATAQQQLGRELESVNALAAAYALCAQHGLYIPILSTIERLVFSRGPLGTVVRELLDDPTHNE